MSGRRVFVFLGSAYFVVVAGCSDLGTDASLVDEVRIIFGKSIDGITIAMDSSEVIDLLGPPDEMFLGDFPGVGFLYTQGKYAGLDVIIYTSEGNSTDLLGVVSVRAGTSYSGKSRENIGIGSSRDLVLRIIGQPDESVEGSTDTTLFDRYFYESNMFIILYSDGQIQGIIMSVLRST